MLVLSRKTGEQIVVPQCQLTVTVLEIAGNRVRLGIAAPAGIEVHRNEVWQRTANQLARRAGDDFMPIRILIADADEFLTATYRESLCRQGATVGTATTGLECMERLRDAVPDVLVLEPEILWGGGDGLLAWMHEQPEFRPASVMLLTRGGNRSLLYRLSPFRVDDYQIKPLATRHLAERICKLVVRHNIQAELTALGQIGERVAS
jgi:carbon storage regulator CsrA